jgi:predicted MPP superfamily phosphohydrolase
MDTYIELNRNFYPIKDNEKDLEEAKIMSVFGYDKFISWEELLQKPRVVILAEPGTGKTEELRAVTNRLRSTGNTAFFCRIELLEELDIRQALDIGTSEEFNNWLSGDQEGYFFLDSVDEAHLKGRSTFEIAIRQFAEKINEHKDRIKVFLTCRVSDWRTTTDLELFQKLLPIPQPINLIKENKSNEGIQVNPNDEPEKENEKEDNLFQLLPLNDHQIELFAKEKGIKNIKTFMEAIERENATMFAERPQDLLDLIEYWKSKNCFGRHAEMVEFNIQKKLTENDSDRDVRRPLSLEEALIGAERLAAAITLQKKNLIVLPDKNVGLTRREVSINSKEVLVDWPSDKIQTLLNRPIFDVAIYGTVQFHHRIVREYLTAKWFKRLLKKGKSRKSIEKYFFANMYGQDVVIPSMRPIVAWLSLWDEQIRIQVKRLAPEILIENGDPSSLPLEFRKSFLIDFTEHYAERQHTGISFNKDMLRRLADPQLTTTVNELLEKFSNHTDISHMLLIMIWQGQISESVDKALSCAFDKQADLYSRIWAIKAVATAGTPEQHKLLIETLLDDISKLDSKILGEICESFFPNTLSVQQLLQITETVKSTKQDYTNPVERSLDRITDTLLSDEVVKEILQGLYKLLKRPPFISDTYCKISQSYVWLLPIAIKFANRYIRKKALFSLETSILDLFLAFITINDSHFYLSERKEIEEILEIAKAWPEFRIELFWHTTTVIRAAREKEKNDKIVLWNQVSWYIKDLWTPSIDDLNSLFEALEKKPLIDDRLVALSAIFQIYIDTKRQRQLLYRLKQAVKSDLQLEKTLNGFLHPKPLTEEQKKVRRSYQNHLRRAKKNRQQDDISLKWKQELMKKPEENKNVGNAEKGEIWQRTVYLYNQIPEKKNSSRLGLSNWQSLINDYNYEVAKNFRDGCTAYWRKYDPFSDEHIIAFLRGTSNTIPWPLIIGLTGLAMEANDDPNWVKQISLDEARIAAHYSICELNGFPDWFNSLSDAFPDIVDNVIINQLRWELQNDSANIHSSRTLSALTYNRSGVSERYKIALVELLSEKEPMNDEALEDALSIIIRGKTDLCLRERISKIVCKHFEETSDENRKIKWLKYIFYIDGLKGINILKKLITDFPLIEEKKNFMIKFCAVLDEQRDEDERFGRNITRDFEKVEILSDLVPLICQYVKPEEDRHRRTGAYKPNTKDKAEQTRSRLLSVIADIPGFLSYNTLVNLSTIGNSSYFRDRMDYLAKNRAALDAEFGPWTGSSIIKFEDITVKNEKHDPQDYIHLLHLSDLHFTKDISPDVKLHWLLQDIRHGDCLGFNKIEYLVISGDFTDRGNDVGFDQARQFISRLMGELCISEDCCILVPGNHDIDYNMCPNGLKGFSESLFNKIVKTSYPLEPDEQSQSYLYTHNCIQFITLNSGWQIDRLNPKRASINPNALAYILNKAEKEKNNAINEGELNKNQKFLRIAVFHHPVTHLETMRNQNFIEHLRQNDVQLILHGDIHEINREIYKGWERSKVQIIGAGTFGAKANDRPESIPRLYNLLEIKKDLGLIRIHTRQQRKIDGPWEGWYEWPDPSNSDAHLPYFDITI